MIRPPLQSSPPSQPSPYRYLGRGGGERPVQLQIIIALVAALILVAVPLYLWRRPQPDAVPNADAAVVDGGAPTLPQPLAIVVDAGAPGVKLSPYTTIKTPPERCDHVQFFEDALARAVRDNLSCAPAAKTSYTVSFLVDSDFRRKKWTLSTGKSSSLKKDKSRELVRCLKKAMPTPDWATIPHQYARYKVNVTATYPATETAP
jgi:hypothetical protein